MNIIFRLHVFASHLQAAVPANVAPVQSQFCGGTLDQLDLRRVPMQLARQLDCW